MKFSRVINDQICFHSKEVYDVYEMFHTRYRMHKQVYNHRVGKAVEYMISGSCSGSSSSSSSTSSSGCSSCSCSSSKGDKRCNDAVVVTMKYCRTVFLLLLLLLLLLL